MRKKRFLPLVLLSIVLLALVVNFCFANEDPFPGPPPICPRWALEPWVWEDNINTQAAIEKLVQDYLDRNIPVGAVIIDSPWETCYNNFEWWDAKYPNPQQMIAGFHSDGIKVIMWITGFINGYADSDDDSPDKICQDYGFVKSQGYAVNNGEDFNWWKGKGVHIDFTNAEAKQWWHQQMDKVLVDMNIDGWKTDRGADYVSDPVNTSIGSIQRQEFKKHYYADIYDYSTSVKQEAIITARAYSKHQGEIGASISKNPIAWQGDYSGNFSGLKNQMEDIYESAQRGYGVLTVEVGGYYQSAPTKQSLIRYAQFGALCSGMENGGANGGLVQHLPWKHDDETVEIYRYFATLHSELVPYIFSYSVESNLTGISTLRHVDKDRRHHKLGEEIFVSIITDEGVTLKTVELPEGAKWIDYWQEDRVYDGGTSIDYDMDSIKEFPIFLKVGAIIPMNVKNNVTLHGDDSSAGKITLNIYPGGVSTFTFHRPTGDGIESEDIIIYVDESMGTIKIDGENPLPYLLRVKSFSEPLSVSGVDNWYYDLGNQYVIMNKQGEDFTVTINPLKGYQQDNLLYTPVTPCRIVDTRKAGGSLSPGEIRSYYVHGFLAYQGGNPAGCQSPKGEPYSVHVNVTSVPLGKGWITAYPYGSAAPLASLVNYRSDAQNVANSGTIKTCYNCGKDISIKSGGGTTHVIIDVLGYYYSKP